MILQCNKWPVCDVVVAFVLVCMACGILFLSYFVDDDNSVAVDTVWYKIWRDSGLGGIRKKYERKN